MGILDPAKLAVIFVLALVVLGPEKLPGTARRLGTAWRTMAQFREQAQNEVHEMVSSLDLPTMPTRPSQMMSNFVSDFTRVPNGRNNESLDGDDLTNETEGHTKTEASRVNATFPSIARSPEPFGERSASRGDVTDVTMN